MTGDDERDEHVRAHAGDYNYASARMDHQAHDRRSRRSERWPGAGDVGFFVRWDDTAGTASLERCVCVEVSRTWRTWQLPDDSRRKTNGTVGMGQRPFRVHRDATWALLWAASAIAYCSPQRGDDPEARARMLSQLVHAYEALGYGRDRAAQRLARFRRELAPGMSYARMLAPRCVKCGEQYEDWGLCNSCGEAMCSECGSMDVGICNACADKTASTEAPQ